MMARFLLESNRRFCAIVRHQVQKSCQETAGRLFIEGGVVVITNEKSACVQVSRIELDWLVGMSHGRL
jgi:hypothetical protein